jgi:hypothetical protein
MYKHTNLRLTRAFCILHRIQAWLRRVHAILFRTSGSNGPRVRGRVAIVADKPPDFPERPLPLGLSFLRRDCYPQSQYGLQ